MDMAEVKFGTRSGGRTIPELFDYYYGEELPPDPLPGHIRARFIFLSGRNAEALYEKTIDRRRNGGKGVGVWNNVLTMIKMEVKITENINMSVCSELKLTPHIQT